MLLPWGDTTVVGHVVSIFLSGGLEDVILITGAARNLVESAIRTYPIRMIHNENYATGQMLSSIQCGLRAMADQAQAALIGLGDQPQVQAETVQLICQAYRESHAPLVVPSFQMRRGHPWLVARPLWGEILALKHSESPRDFLTRHANEIHHVNVHTSSVLADLDTPEDYENSRPKE